MSTDYVGTNQGVLMDRGQVFNIGERQTYC